jgi:ATP/maltotriose-dependent transcriptional regulator MalT
VLSPVAGALRPLLPELAASLPPGLDPLGERSAERHRVFRGLVELLAALGPSVVVLEDLHWADEHTVDFVRYLLDDPPSTLVVVLTYRGEELPDEVRTLGSRLAPAITATELELQPLDVHETGALAAAIVGADRVSPEFAGYLHERTSGLPLAVEEVMALLRERGVVTRRGERWARRALGDLEVPRAIRDHVLERVRRLPTDARSMIEAAAVLQAPASDQLIAAVSGQRPSAAAGLGQALDSGIMVEYGDLVGFRHVLASEAIYHAIPGPRRRALHDRAADEISGLGSVGLGRLAHHLRRAGRLDEWTVASEKAADQAVELGHDEEAVRLLDEVLREMPDGLAGRGRIAAKLAKAAMDAGRGPDVLDLLRQVLEQGSPRDTPGELRFYMAILMDNNGADPAVTYRLLAESVTNLDDRPDLKVWAMIGLGLPRTGVPIAEHLTWLRRALRGLGDVDDPAFTMFARGKIAMILVSIGDREWKRLTDQIAEQTSGRPRRPREVVAYGSIGIGACYTGHHEVAGKLLAAAEVGAASLENPHPMLVIRSAKAVLDYVTGTWGELDDEFADLLDQLDGQPRLRIDLEVVAGCRALSRGEPDAHRRLTDLVDQLHEMGGVELLAVPASALLRAAIARGDIDGALKEADRLLSAVEPCPIWVPTTRAIPALVETYVAADQPETARSLLARVGAEFRALDAPLLEPGTDYARGVLAMADRRWRSAAEHLLTAAAAYDRLTCPYEAAQARERAAAALFGADDATAAAEPLRAALLTYRGLAAGWDLDRAASTAREHGVTVPSTRRGGRRGYGNALSPRERTVAELAATGRSNKDIAAELFLSPETVKKHMQAAMRKLGVRSRAALGSRLRRGT